MHAHCLRPAACPRDPIPVLMGAAHKEERIKYSMYLLQKGSLFFVARQGRHHPID